MGDLDNAAWHSPRPWKVATSDFGQRFYVEDATGSPVTASICREDAEKIAALGNATKHAHERSGEIRSPSRSAARRVE